MKNNPKNPLTKLNNFIHKDEKKFVLSDFNHALGPFSFLFQMRKWWWRILVSIIVGVLMGLTVLFFIQNTGLYSSGLAGFFQGISRISYASMISNNLNPNDAKLYYNLLFYGMYFLVNIPLLFFAYYKIGKNFAILSFNVLLLQNLVPILLGLIPGINEVQIFGNAKTTLDIGNNDIIMLTFYGEDISKFGSIITYSIIAGLIIGVNYALILVVSGSTGGLDFISFYYSIKKGKPIGLIITYFNLCSIIISSVIGTFIPVSMSIPSSGITVDNEIINPYSYHFFFSQNLVMSLLMVIISSLVLNLLFPKNKIVKVGIYSDNIIKIRDELYKNDFHHALTIHNTIGGYSLKEKQNADIICLYIELPKLLHKIHEIDPNSLITITHLIGIKGKFKVEESIN